MQPLADKDLPKIRKEMQKIIRKNLPFIREELSPGEARARIEAAGEPYKLEILESIMARCGGSVEYGESRLYPGAGQAVLHWG